MAHVTRIKAGASNKEVEPKKAAGGSQKKNSKKAEKVAKPAAKPMKAVKAAKAEKPAKEKHTPGVVVALTAPFKAMGRYFSSSWKEIRQVRWPNRKATWKMVLAVFAYTAIFMVFIMLLDALLSLLFNNILK